MAEARIRFWPALRQARIAPEIFGHFSEHVGRCIYEGLYVGNGTRVPQTQGIRMDVLAAIKHLRAPVMRWPGGCFADDYHWRNGIGPQSKRPQTVNLWWGQTEPHEFGTDEFLRFCELADIAPYICVNLGSGSPREAREWVEYCNFPGDSALSRLRAKNGHPEPYQAPYWGIGNENWGCGGNLTGADYAREYARFATYMRAMDPGIRLFACGASMGDYKNPVQNNWNDEVCRELRRCDLLDGLCLHRYFTRGKGRDFTQGEHYALFADVFSLERDLELTDALLRYHFPNKSVQIVVDEWGVWHPEAVADNGLEQPGTLRDALMAASVLHLFIRWSRRVGMANIAQTVNALQCLAKTRGADMFLTPTYHVFEMMRPHMNAAMITSETDGPAVESHPVGFPAQVLAPLLDACASISGKKVLLSMVNKSLTDTLETRIEAREAEITNISGRQLQADHPSGENSFETPSAVSARRIKPSSDGKEAILALPPHSFTVLTLSL